MTVSLRLPAQAALAITGLALLTVATPAAGAMAASTPAAPDGAVAAAHTVTPRTAAGGGAQLWQAPFGKGLGFGSLGSATAVSPDGSTVFVAGDLPKGPTATTSASAGEVVAYKAATGAVIWQHQYNPSPASTSAFKSIVVSPNGSTVFVTGATQPRQHGPGSYLTIAYDAATGARLWADHGQIQGSASAVTVSPDGSTVFVTGQGNFKPLNPPPLNTVAYNAATGATDWAKNTTGIIGMSITVSPDGSAVFVTGVPETSGPTITGISATTGATLWTQNKGISSGRSVAASPDGSAVFVTGSGTSGFPTTAAYSASTGATRWMDQSKFQTNALGLSSDGSTLFVTGTISTIVKGQLTPWYVTAAYHAATGSSLWQARYRGGQARAIAVSPDGSKVFVTGNTANVSNTLNGYGTVAYNATTGTELWAARDLTTHIGGGISVAVSPNGSAVFVTGELQPQGANPDMVTVAYRS